MAPSVCVDERRDETRRRLKPGECSMRAVASFFRDESAVTAVKYGLIAACISLAIVTVLQGVGSRLLLPVE